MRTKEVKDWLNELCALDGRGAVQQAIDDEIAMHIVRVWEMVETSATIAPGPQRDRALSPLLGYFGELRTQLGVLQARAKASQRHRLQREAEARAGRQAT